MRARFPFLALVLVASVSWTVAARAADDLAQRDLAAFLAYSQARHSELEDAIKRKDKVAAKALASRLHLEECRFLERVVQYCKEARSLAAAQEVEMYLPSFRMLSLADTVRLRRSAGPSQSHVHGLALAALSGNIGPAPAPRFEAPPPVPAHALPLQASVKIAPKTRFELDPTRIRDAKLARADVADLPSRRDRPNYPSRTGSGSEGGVNLEPLGSGSGSEEALASSIRVPGSGSGAKPATGAGARPASTGSGARIYPTW